MYHDVKKIKEMAIPVLPDRILSVVEELIEQYQEEDRYTRPWIIGFSGGKDSTVLLTLVWIALLKIREKYPSGDTLKRHIYVVCNDTMVENPVIEEYVNTVLLSIRKAATKQNLPITVKITRPQIEDTFWFCVIGKGYPVPNNSFRFCTEKMKIKPTSTFITNQVATDGEAIILIGTRSEESQQRARSIKKHDIKGQRLSKHPLNPNTYTYAPIKKLTLEEVWYVVNTVTSPWGSDNQMLFKIYVDASADDYECPTVVTNDSHRSCGQSRFGCWVCTVVKEDKSMSSLIKNGLTWMTPLLQFRNDLVANRNISENRSETRRNGQAAIDETGHKMGNYTMVYRVELLRKLLIIQKDLQQCYRSSIELINAQELTAIQTQWYKDGNFQTDIKSIFNEISGYSFSSTNMELQERILLESVCKKPSYYLLIQELLALQKNKILLMKKYRLQTDIETRLDEFVNQ
jgi:DNA sulfur modification protein DndC